MCDVKVCMSENQCVYCAYFVYACFLCDCVYWHMVISWVTVSLILDFFLMHGLAIFGPK